jgi:hypothetical protein
METTLRAMDYEKQLGAVDNGKRTVCRVCAHIVAPSLGAYDYGEVESGLGLPGRPCAPGDWDDICDHCYVEQLS